ncbi:MAG: hypothetical protein P1P86_03860 [Bacteroidales bacterium]|nr:hypothetical protein [Bacteroidales bacterium]
MRVFIWIIAFIALAGCANDDLSWISIKNDTTTPIYVLPYSSEFANAEWIQPGVSDDFYSIGCDLIDAYSYFSFYYDSLIVLLKDYEDEPIKFYKDGTTVNYDPEFNPFTNPDVWQIQDFNRAVSGKAFNTLEEKHIFEHYFCIRQERVKSLSVEEESDPGL